MLIERLTEDMKAAMKGREALRTAVLRLTLAEIKNARIEKQRDLTDEDVVQLLRREIKRRQDSVEQFRAGGREDLVARESQEIEILAVYLPRLLSPEELAAAVAAAVTETGASGPKDLGKVMKAVMASHPGRVDGKALQALVRGKLEA
jgi:uncharacterized protein YqeY